MFVTHLRRPPRSNQMGCEHPREPLITAWPSSTVALSSPPNPRPPTSLFIIMVYHVLYLSFSCPSTAHHRQEYGHRITANCVLYPINSVFHRWLIHTSFISHQVVQRKRVASQPLLRPRWARLRHRAAPRPAAIRVRIHAPLCNILRLETHWAGGMRGPLVIIVLMDPRHLHDPASDNGFPVLLHHSLLIRPVEWLCP